MIDQNRISIDWINEVSLKNRNADKILVEKVIRALLLLEGLAQEHLYFVFKGGTALMLHFNSTRRLSIDIDILLSKMPEKLNDSLDIIAIKQGFTRLELNPRSSHSKINKVHYKFFYKSIYSTGKAEDYIMLDILIETINYEKIVQLPVQSVFVPSKEEPVFVQMPSMEDILADKLTAFAPNSTGIPYFKNSDSMGMEIIKQLYDIGSLFDVAENLEVIKSTFYRFAKTELEYKTSTLSVMDVLEDIFQTSLCIVSRGTDGVGDFEQLRMGLKRVKGFIFSENYHIEKAIAHATKAAYLSVLIKHDAEKLVKFSPLYKMDNWKIDLPYNTKLNKLKKSNPEAFFYWYKMFELQSAKENN
ncbi:MAG: nucleotidyl transferase AbiEii/AbiGii toxin family protein [Ignavibacteriales bacterium]|nr:nucleotidyl transferase AbiEii/AbiGii toxin family protein [Ignavibacteriales bacterium]